MLTPARILTVSVVGDPSQVTQRRRIVRGVQATCSCYEATTVRVSWLQSLHFHLNPSRLGSLKDPPVLLPTIIAGLQTYFDRALGANLLYRFERPQYAEIRKKYVTGPKVVVGQEKEMSAIYGAEHLLRMLGTFQHTCGMEYMILDDSCTVSPSEPPPDGR